MSLLKTVALSLAVVSLSAFASQAAPHHKKHAHHAARHATHMAPHSSAMARGAAPARGAVSGDRSADALNAQSLQRAQGAQ